MSVCRSNVGSPKTDTFLAQPRHKSGRVGLSVGESPGDAVSVKTAVLPATGGSGGNATDKPTCPDSPQTQAKNVSVFGEPTKTDKTDTALLTKRLGRASAAMPEGVEPVSENRRRARWDELARKGVAVHRRKQSLVDRLERGWWWLADHPDAADFAEREDRWLAWIAEYEACCDALRAAEGAL